MEPRTISKTPITTGTSVIGVKYDGGVVIAADMLGSYGSLARFRNISRLKKVNKNIMIGASGDYADYQYLCDIISQKIIDEDCLDDGFHLKPKELHSWLTRVLYNRRSKFDPLWTTFIVGGVDNGEPYLGFVDKLGTAFVDRHIATGFGTHIALPMLRDAQEKKEFLSKDEAIELINKCMETLYYRDARSFPKYEIGVVSPEGTEIIGPLEVKGNWDVAHMIKGYE